MSLRHPEFLFLLIPALVLLWLAYRRGSAGAALRYPLSFRPLPWHSHNLRSRELLRLGLRAAICSLLIFAIARPQSSSSNIKRSSEGIDIMITLDVSKSMTIEDYGQMNRLDLAKKTIKQFIAGRQDDRIGFVEFSGESVTLCPPTLDYPVLLDAVDRASTEVLKDGTAIGDAVANSVNRLRDSTAKSRVIILVTDGDNNMGAIAPLTAGSLAQGYGIRVYTIALGKDGIGNMPVYEDFFGQVRKTYQQMDSSINPELLKKIASETGGQFFRASEQNDLGEIFKSIDHLERSPVERKEKIHWNEKFQFFVLFALIFLFLEFVLGKTFLRILPT